MSAEYTLEQRFAIRAFTQQVSQMSREQSQDFLVKLYEQMLLRENMYRELFKTHWQSEINAEGINNEQI